LSASSAFPKEPAPFASGDPSRYGIHNTHREIWVKKSFVRDIAICPLQLFSRMLARTCLPKASKIELCQQYGYSLKGIPVLCKVPETWLQSIALRCPKSWHKRS
jgi:hypothetical protein